MNSILKKSVAWLLVVLQLLLLPITVLADTPGGSMGANLPIPKPGGSGYTPKAGIFRDYGFRVTITKSYPIQDAGVSTLTGDYSKQDLENQRNSIEAINETRYWESGDYGLYYWKGLNGGIKPNRGITSAMPGDAYDITTSRQKMVSSSVNIYDNSLAWMCYPGIDGLPRAGGAPECDNELYDMVVNANAQFTNGDDWLFHARMKYECSPKADGSGLHGDDYVELMQRLISDGTGTADNLRKFSWDTDEVANDNAVSAQNKVFWSRIGYVTTLMQFAWTAEKLEQNVPGKPTYTAFKDAIWSWVSSGYDPNCMPILMIEACNEISVDGTPTAANNNCMLATLPYTLNAMYGSDVSAQLFNTWPTDAQGSTEKAIASIVGDRSPIVPSVVGQALGYYYDRGQYIPLYGDRAFCNLLWPVDGARERLSGYIIGFTYCANTSSSGPPTGQDPPGSFTWKLTPNGVIDKTPATELNVSSTIYDLNVSQNGYNKNNYDKWETLIRGDNSDSNKVKFNIYRISEALPQDFKSTRYTREQIRASGKTVPTPVDRVTVLDGKIKNIPSLGEVDSGQESRILTDDELLNILKTGTGLTYTESIVGPIVNEGTPNGIRVSYAVYMQVNPGIKGWRDFTNEQAEYVEYRSEPGTYTWTSDDPKGYAEIKCGYFDSSKYEEPYEAMAGAPTTENLYFTSGGQEFVAQIKYQYTQDKNTIRNFEQKYTTETCAGWYKIDPKQEWTDAPTETINGWAGWNQLIEGENSKTCTECGYQHFAGANAHETPYVTNKSGTGGGTLNFGPGYWDTSFEEVRWDWSAPAVSAHGHTEGDGENSHWVQDCSGAPAMIASDVADPGEPPTCGCGTSSSWSKTKVTRWTGKCFAEHKDYNDGSGTEKLTSSIKFQQEYQNMNYAKIKEAHVWRLEEARVEGIRQLTFEQDDAILADAEELSNVIFNVAETDNAKEGRMYYALHPTNADDFVFTQTLKTRGCCVCHNHNAAEDLIASTENPNNLFEEAWCISDYLILEAVRAKTSLLYYEYQTLNAQNKDKPILRLRVTGTDPTSRQDNGYIITREGVDEFRGLDNKGQVFKTEPISYNKFANADNGTEERICQNAETFYGGNVDSDDISWGGYNGDYSGTTKDLASGTSDPSAVKKYSGRTGNSNFKGKGSKKIFKTGYIHSNQGEVNGFSTSSPQQLENPNSPFVLTHNDIDTHDVKVVNGRKSFSNPTIFYHNIISYGGGELWDETEDATYKKPGFHRKTDYSKSTSGINDIVIHNPVSTQFARLIPLPSKLDQRVDTKLILDSLNQDNNKCPGKANTCKYAHVNCKYDGTRYHTDDCYVEVRGTGLATVPVKGTTTTAMKPVQTKTYVSGSKQFAYTGSRQTFTAPETGRYKFDLYGAQGGTSDRGGSGGLGGRAYGDVYLTKGQTVYIYVGGAGNIGYTGGGYNGGGGGAHNGGSGGGMTSISLDPSSAAAPSNYRATSGQYLCTGAACMSSGKHNSSKCPYAHTCDGCSTCHTCKNNGYYKPTAQPWNNSLSYMLVAGAGAGAGPANGGAGGGTTGSTGTKRFGTAGTGGTQTSGGIGGNNYGNDGLAGCGGSNSISVQSGGGGGGGGWYGGGAGGNDYSKFRDIDDSGGGGGSGYINSGKDSNGNAYVTGGNLSTGVRSGHGLVNISYNIQTEVTTYVPVISGTYEYDKTQADVLPVEFKPHIYTAPETGMYSIHLYGAAGGGAAIGKASAGGTGGHAAGQVYLTKGQKILVTVGGTGSNGNTVGYEHSGGYNGGGYGGTTSGGSFGGGGATDIALNYVHQDAAAMSNMTSGGVLKSGTLDLSAANSYYKGPHITTYKGHIYRVDYCGENLDNAKYEAPNQTLLWSYITAEHAQLFYQANSDSSTNGQEFKVLGNGVAKLKETYVVDMNDRLLVAGAGGGADNETGTLNGENDGRGGAGGGLSGEDGYTNGVRTYLNAGAKATSGYAQGIGENSVKNSDRGAGGAGWYGGSKGADGNSGGGGGSSNIGKVQNGETQTGQNTGSGYAVIVKPGKGVTANTHQLSCNEPHHAPNSNWHRYTDGWIHEGGFTCTGVGCVHCANKVPMHSPTGYNWTIDELNSSSYVIKHDGKYHLTEGTDTWCDECNSKVEIDKYTLDGKNYKECIWKATMYDAACYDTRGALSAEYHYTFGDDTCYDPCLDDAKHKVVTQADNDENSPERAGQFVVLDYDFQVYFPNKGDFYGNGMLGIKSAQKPEGFGYVDDMDTTIWLKEKYLVFPFDVTYKGHTYLAGERVVLGTYDESTYTWHDDDPVNYQYTFHCLLSNREAAASKIRFVATAKNTPTESLENTLENRNYTRYGEALRANHDAFKEYFIDVIGRIGVLSIEDTGDFRFSNYYKQAVSGWKIDQVVHEVDLGKQNFVSVDQQTIFGDNITEQSKGQNTWGLTNWLEPIDKLRPFPLTPGENNLKALKNQAHRIGYSDYMSLVTVGDYYGENKLIEKDLHKVQIQPYYYYYNLETKEWVPVDVYIKDGAKYRSINLYGSKQSTADYNFYYDMNWETESRRRMYTSKEEDATNTVQDGYYQIVPGEEDLEERTVNNILIPRGIKWLHGTANMLFLRDGNRTFIGTRNRYGEDTEADGRISDIRFNRQAQRWNFTLGLPSTATFVHKGDPCTPENIKKYDMSKGVIICALDILARGDVWTLHYDGVPTGERSFYLSDNNTTLISWESAGTNGPESKPVVVVYTDAKTSRNDLGTEGTH